MSRRGRGGGVGAGGGGGDVLYPHPHQAAISGRGDGVGAGGGGADVLDPQTHHAAISGRGDGLGAGDGGGDHLDPQPHQPAISETIFLVDKRIEAYEGENEELDNLETLLSVRESVLEEFLQAEPISAAEQVQVEQEENQLGPADLQACLRQREWNRALDILSQMVRDGKAAASAVSNDAQPLDITKAHPELVLLLRGQALFDLKGMGNAIRAHAYYLNYICEMYPSDFSCSIEFVDTLLADIHAMARNEALSRNCRFNDRKKTCQCINDYLKIYFPSFRDVEIEDGVLSIGLFGEKNGNEVRCLACHDFKRKKFSVRKLYYHQLCDPEGRQALCPASTEYIRKKVQDVLPKPEAATDYAQEL